MKTAQKLITKIIVNPAAGANSSHRKWLRISELLKHIGFHFDYEYTDCSGHAVELARDAAKKGYNHIVAVGGDGTVNEVANGILGSVAAKETSLGIISTGTGGDFIRSLGIPRHYLQACSRISSPERLLVDAGIVEYQSKGQKLQRFFLNTAGIGLDAAVVEATQKIPKQFGGTIPYLLGLIRALITYKNKSVTITTENIIENQRVVGVIIANGCYAGGGMQFAPFAKLNDGLLDTIIVGDFGKVELLRAFPRVYKGTHIHLPKINTGETTDISIQSYERALIYADGELLGESPARFRVVPSALQIVI